MTAPKLHTSTELIVVRAGGNTIDQAVARTLCGQDSSPGSPPASSATRSLVNPISSGSASATAAILRPAVQHRPEWFHDLGGAAPFVLPDTFIQQRGTHSSFAQPRPIRYIADRYDLQWVSRWAETYGSTHLPACRSFVGSTPHPRGAEWDRHRAHLDLLEECFTALETAAYEKKEVPIESIPLRLPNGTLSREGSAAALDAIRAYWVTKRHAAGAARPLIPVLHQAITHEYTAVGPQVDLLGDCPLPFKQREWSAPVIRRKTYSGTATSCSPSDGVTVTKQSSKHLYEGESTSSPELLEASALIDRAVRLSEAVHMRESLRHRHTQLALYELALLRHADNVEAASQSSWQRLQLVLKRSREDED